MGQLQNVSHMHNRNTRNREKEKGTCAILEAIMNENFPKLMSDMKLQIQEALIIPRRINAKKRKQNLQQCTFYSNYKKKEVNKVNEKNLERSERKRTCYL